MRIPQCITCNIDMKYIPNSSKPRKGKSGIYCSRKFRCEICDYEEVVNGNGSVDIDMNPLEFKEVKRKEMVNYIDSVTETITSVFGVTKD